jgi:ubiquinone/menaquinone biosynthesis C-methylase UbiE
MLAPRKTLWSTPLSAVDHLERWIGRHLQDGDKICDIGCGDGRILLEWAQRIQSSYMNENNDNTRSDVDDNTRSDVVPKVTLVGIDIDADRIRRCQAELEKLQRENRIHHQHLSISFVCGNALDSAHLLKDTTVVFLYLIPRGLKLMHPILQQLEKPLKVVTYMAKLPGETVTDRALLELDHQPGAAWPLYFYDLR